MLRIIITQVVICLLVMGFCGKAQAEMPGFLELNMSIQRWDSLEATGIYYNTEIGIKYGGEFGYFKPYLLVNTQTFFQMTNEFDRNHPFRDVYTFGGGVMINDVFYFEALHTCSHFVYSNVDGQREFERTFTKFKNNHFKIGIKLTID